jgi:fatty-acid desaturase
MVFVAWVVMPAILAPIGFGLVNGVCHKHGESRNFPLVNILTAGEGYHLEHHNGKNLRYHKWDFTGYVLENLSNLNLITKFKD